MEIQKTGCENKKAGYVYEKSVRTYIHPVAHIHIFCQCNEFDKGKECEEKDGMYEDTSRYQQYENNPAEGTQF